MKDSDRDLIAALADGSLPPADAAALQARIAGDPVAEAELDTQRAALAALAAADRPRLTSAERDDLHRSLMDQLGLEPASEDVPERRRRFRVNWGGLAVAAAAVFAIAVIAPLTNLLTTSDDGTADTTVLQAAEEMAPATTEAPAAAVTDTDGAALTQRDSAAGDSAPAAAAAPTTTMAAELAAEAAPPADPTFADGGEVAIDDVDGFLSRLALAPDRFGADDVVAAEDEQQLHCEAEAAAAAPEDLLPLRPLVTVVVDGSESVAWGNVADPAAGRFVVLLSVADCEIVRSRTEPPAP